MPTKHIENTTDAPIYVGGKMIQPGTGRDIDVALLPPEFQEQTAAAAPAEPTLADLIEALRAKSVALSDAWQKGAQQLSEQQLAVVSFIARAADAHLHERIQALTLLANSIGPEAMADSAGLQHLLDSQPLLPSLRRVLADPAFRRLLAVFVANGIAVTIAMTTTAFGTVTT